MSLTLKIQLTLVPARRASVVQEMDGEPSSFQSLRDLSFGSRVGTLSLLLLLPQLLLQSAIESRFGESLLADKDTVFLHTLSPRT